MWGRVFPSKKDSLSPQAALELSNAHLDSARNAKSSEMALMYCGEADTALTRIKRSKRKDLVVSSTAENRILRNGIAATYFALGQLLSSLGHREMAHACDTKAEKWEGRVQDPGQSSSHNDKVALPPTANPDNDPNMDPATSGQISPISLIRDKPAHKTAKVPQHIFAKNMYQPPDINKSTGSSNLPRIGESLENISQVAYCLSLLGSSQSPEQPLDQNERNWLKAIENDASEMEWFDKLATDLCTEFLHHELQGAKAVTEIVSLAPFLKKDDIQKLLQWIFRATEQSGSLDFNLLGGLAQLLQHAAPGHLNADNLIKILGLINTPPSASHQQSPDHIYKLTQTVSHVLDAMVDSRVKGLDQEKLLASLAAYLHELQDNTDPCLVYQAAYASQALLYISDDEKLWQATVRQTRKMVKGVSGLVAEVKGLYLNRFMQGLVHIQDGLANASRTSMLTDDAYENLSTLARSGRKIQDYLRQDLSFSHKRAWYPALRGADVFLRNGQLTIFETLVCNAPCRRDPVFQWGICQRLGELAANVECDDDSRASAVAFLGEIYQNDSVWGQNTSIKQWILDILMWLDGPSGGAMQAADTLLQELEKDGNSKKQELYRFCREYGPGSHLLKPSLLPLPLPDRVHSKFSVEANLWRIRKRRIQARDRLVYVPLLARANIQARNDTLFSLMEKVNEFLASDGKVFLLLGDSASGKSTFNQRLECDLWNKYKKKEDRIPIFINLAAIENPEHELVAKHLRKEGFTEREIRELKDYRELILICDGYDDSRHTHNLYMGNQLNQEGGWRARMVISCRSEYLGADYQDRFQPLDRNRKVESLLFQEAVIAPFSEYQIQEYVKQYVSEIRVAWSASDYLQALDQIHGLKDLVTNPFLLTLSLEVLPRMVHSGQTLSAARITRVALYDQFVEQWLERGKIRLLEIAGNSEALQSLCDEGFMRRGAMFLKELAIAIYERQAGDPVVVYSSTKDKGTWKEEFFGEGREQKLLREACPITRNGNQYRFLHKSLLEYSLARAIFEPQEEGNNEPEWATSTTIEFGRKSESSTIIFETKGHPHEMITEVGQPVLDSPLGRKYYVGEPSILQFLAERVHQEPLFKKQLLSVIERSKTDGANVEAMRWAKVKVRLAATNAITILVRAGVQFNGADLQGIQIPGADLSHGAFEFTQFQGANMSEVILRGVSLLGADLSKAQMSGVEFGELPYLREQGSVASCVYSPDGETFAAGLVNGNISVYKTSGWGKMITICRHGSGVVYSPRGDQIASGNEDGTVRLWDVETGECRNTLIGHGDRVQSVVYSPKGDQIASGSLDKTVRLWDVETGHWRHTLSGHSDSVWSVVYSPKGDQIASGSFDSTVKLWDVETGDCRHTLSGHFDSVLSVVYSPKGGETASGSEDGTVRLWDIETGECRHTLSGHSNSVESLVYSPKGDQIASGSRDKIVRLWDVETGDCRHTLSGHRYGIYSVVYSPKGDQIASGSEDGTVRLWDVETGDCRHTLSGHSDSVWSVVYSPNGDQIASGSSDMTVRMWDVETGDYRHTQSGHSESVESVVYSPRGDQIASGSKDRTVRLWNVETGECRHTLSGHIDSVQSVVYSPKGDQIASGSRDKTVRLWDVETGYWRHTLSGHIDSVQSVVYSPKDDQIASGSRDKTVRLWDVETGDCCHTLCGHSKSVESVVYSPRGDQIASGSEDGTVRLWNVETGECRHTLSGHNDHVQSVVYSPKGDQIASGSWDKTVRLWDVETGYCRHTLSGHSNRISSIVYSPNGGQIAFASADMTVWLWDVVTGRRQLVIQTFDEVRSIAWKAILVGNCLVTGGTDGSVRLWLVTEDGSECNARLHWRSPPNTLSLIDTSIQDVEGLNSLNKELLKQRGAVGEPAPL